MTLFSQPKKKLFHELFYFVFWREMDTQIVSKVKEIMSKLTLEMKSKKTSIKGVKSDAVRLVKNEFSIGRVVKNHENQRCVQLRKHVEK